MKRMMNWEPVGIPVIGGHEHSNGSQEDLLYTVVAYALGLFVVASFLPIQSWGDFSNPVICLAV